MPWGQPSLHPDAPPPIVPSPLFLTLWERMDLLYVSREHEKPPRSSFRKRQGTLLGNAAYDSARAVGLVKKLPPPDPDMDVWKHQCIRNYFTPEGMTAAEQREKEVRAEMNAEWRRCWSEQAPTLNSPDSTLYIKTSQIPGAGRGLFTSVPIKAKAVICPYYGDIHTDESFHKLKKRLYGFGIQVPREPWEVQARQPLRNVAIASFNKMIREEGIPGGPHRLRLPKERRNIVVDPGPYEDVAGRYANDASRVGGNNCSFASELHNLRALLVADKDIGADEEIFVDYGGSYWEPDPPIEGDDKSLTSRNACKFKGGGFDEDLPERKRIEAERRRKEEAKKEEEEGKNEERYVVG